MPNIRYITSPSQIGAPGVYVLEQAPAVPTRGQRRRTALFVGQCVRGPVNKDVICRSYARFLDVFGGRDRNTNGGAILGDVWKALQGRSWGVIHVIRAAAAAAVKASYTVESAAGGGGTQVMRIDASSVGSWGNDVYWKVMDASNGDAAYFNLAIKLYGKVRLYQNLTIQSATLDNTGQVGQDDAELITITALTTTRPVNSTPSTDGADADGYIALGATNAGYTSVAGSDGVIADTDYSAADGPIDTANKVRGVHALAVANRSTTTVKTKIKGLTINQKVWFVCPDDSTVTLSAAITDRATFNSDKISYWFNHVFGVDPITQTQWTEEPFYGPMSVITQTDPDVHVGDLDNAQLYKFATGVVNELGDPDRDAASEGGLSYMMKDLDAKGNQVIIPGDALTCDFTDNNAELDGRYMKDFILDACANRMRGDQFKGNTPENRAARASSISGFLAGLARQGRYIQKDEESGKPQFTYINNASVNNATDQAAGLQVEQLIAQFIPKNKDLLLKAIVGTDASIQEA